MSTTQGYFDETDLQAIRLKADEIAFDDRINLQYIPRIDSMKTIMAKETTKIKQLENPDKDDTVEIEWINTCAVTTQECTTCDFNGTLASTNIQTETLDLCREVEIAVDDNVARTNDFDHVEFVAKLQLQADKQLNEWFNRQILTEILAARGVNLLDPGTNRGCISGTDTYLTAPYWGADIMSYFIRATESNQFGSPYLLSGANFHEAWLNADFNAGNANGKGNKSMFSSMDISFDEWNFTQVFAAINYTFMINNGSIALGNKARYDAFGPSNPRVFKSEDRWSETSRFSSLKFDVHYTNACQTSTGSMLHSWKYILRTGIWFNPTGCNETNTGILAFRCGECP